MTAKQAAELSRLAQGRTYDPDLTRGKASALIEEWGGEGSWYGRAGGSLGSAWAGSAGEAEAPSGSGVPDESRAGGGRGPRAEERRIGKECGSRCRCGREPMQ